jgi:hypothetical protein
MGASPLFIGVNPVPDFLVGAMAAGLIIVFIVLLLMIRNLIERKSMKPIVVFWLFLAWTAAALAQQPNNAIQGDYFKTAIAWNWSMGKKPDAQGFRIYCGDFDNCDTAFCYYSEFLDVPDRSARSILIGSTIDRLLLHEGKSVPGYVALMHVRCVVVAYNAAGESLSGAAGVPNNPTSVRF